jgi:O-acetyl-ADP-ribose deacetylase (regulator of RNase III)
MIEYIVGDATKPVGTGTKLLMHVVNDAGAWGKGFVLAVSKRWKAPERMYREWSRSPVFELGDVQVVDVAPDLAVVNMLAQEGYRGPGPHIRYDALRDCLEAVAREAERRDASVHCPRIGCGLAGGRWEEVLPLIEAALPAVPVYVYDLRPPLW